MSELPPRSASILLPVDRAARRRLKRRHAAERRFRLCGVLAVLIALSALASLLATVVAQGYGAFLQHVVRLEIGFDPGTLGLEAASDRAGLARADYARLVRHSLGELFPSVTERRERRALSALVSQGAAFELRRAVLEEPALVGTRRALELPLSDEADRFFKGKIRRDVQIGWLDDLQRTGRVRRVLNRRFFTSGDSREPELAGIRGALVGSVLTLAVTFALCFPVGVAAAIYLQEFAPRNRATDFIEVNINNLAAVPSIVFGNFFGMPRSAPLVGGLVLALMTLPTVIIAARSALSAVPPSIREAALGIGASPLQTVLQHVLPLAMPGILTGAILGMARALGETAPMLMIGMVAFIVDVPNGPLAPATVLPVQIFLWAGSPARAFVDKTAAAILVLLAFLVAMNLGAIVLRRRFERRW
jgi:phosphate transport system permease protein